MRSIRLGVAVAGTILATGLITTPAGAVNIGISAGTPASFGTTLAPGATVTSTGGTVTVTSLLGLTGWTLTVKDATAAAGRLQFANGPSCAGSTPQLAQRVQIAAVNPLIDSVTIAAQHAVTGTDTTVASYNPLLTVLSSLTLTTRFSQTIGASEVLRAGCVYSTTVTYTVQ